MPHTHTHTGKVWLSIQPHRQKLDQPAMFFFLFLLFDYHNVPAYVLPLSVASLLLQYWADSCTRHRSGRAIGFVIAEKGIVPVCNPSHSQVTFESSRRRPPMFRGSIWDAARTDLKRDIQNNRGKIVMERVFLVLCVQRVKGTTNL